jgi:hypothetical protein
MQLILIIMQYYPRVVEKNESLSIFKVPFY